MDVREIAGQAEWLCYLRSETVDALFEHAVFMTAPEGRLLYEMEEETGGFFALLDGVIGFQTDPGKAMLFAHLMGPGRWFGEYAALTGRPRAVGVEAITACKFLYIKPSLLTELGEQDPAIWRGLAVLSMLNSGIAYRIARDALIRDPRDRLLAVLKRLSEGVGAGRVIPLTQEQLANMCVMSRGATSKVIRQLVNEGILQSGYRRMVLVPKAM